MVPLGVSKKSLTLSRGLRFTIQSREQKFFRRYLGKPTVFRAVGASAQAVLKGVISFRFDVAPIDPNGG